MDRLTPTIDSTVALPKVLIITGTEIQESTGDPLQQATPLTIFTTFSNGEQVWVKTDSKQQSGTVVKPADTLRSCVVETNSGLV